MKKMQTEATPKPEVEYYPTFLWAEIRKSSKYFGQNPGKFPVCVEADTGHYCVFGGDNEYRLADVDLFVVTGENFIKLN